MRLQAPVLLLISCLIVKLGRSQSNELTVQGQTGKLYLEHTVVARDNWYSVGRLYNINPKELATYNHLTFAQPLEIDQVMQVPLTAVNFSQDGKKLATETLVPVIHVVQDKEWLYRISVNHNKVPIPVLEKWNHVKGDQVHSGLHLIVGYLKVKTTLSALAVNGKAPGAVAPGMASAGAGRKTPAGTGGTAGTGAPGGTTPVKTAGSSPGQVEGGTPARAGAGVSAPADSSAASSYGNDSGAAKPVVTVTQKPPVVTQHPAAPAPQFNGGKFKAEFSDGGKAVGGQAGIFKSTSGWQDGKYYALINTVPVGTIVKISDPASGKSVYAKVLGQLPDMKESAGLTIRVSDAAAAELGEREAKFGVGVSY